MRLFHTAGLDDFRVRLGDGPWPLVIPGFFPPDQIEATLTLYQLSAASSPLFRVEIDWLTTLLDHHLRVLEDLQRRGLQERCLIVVHLLHPNDNVNSASAHPALAAFPRQAIVTRAPGGGEPLGPLIKLSQAVTRQLAVLYDAWRARLPLARDMSALDDWWGAFLSPVDRVELANHFVEQQILGNNAEHSALYAGSQIITEQLERLDAELLARLLSAEGPTEWQKEMLYHRQLWDRRRNRWAGWAAKLEDDVVRQKVQSLFVPSKEQMTSAKLNPSAITQFGWQNRADEQWRSLRKIAAMLTCGNLQRADELLQEGQAHGYEKNDDYRHYFGLLSWLFNCLTSNSAPQWPVHFRADRISPDSETWKTFTEDLRAVFQRLWISSRARCGAIWAALPAYLADSARYEFEELFQPFFEDTE